MATIVAFHAHPDDEVLLTGGTLARLASEGHRVIVVVASDGVMGPAAGPAGRVRLEELRASASALGVHRVRHLGYADSGHGPVLYPDPPDRTRFVRADLDEAAGRLASLIRDEHAGILLSYDPQGGNGHPDHVKVHQVGARAAQMTGVRILEATLPRETAAWLFRPVRLLRLVVRYDPRVIRVSFSPGRRFRIAWTSASMRGKSSQRWRPISPACGVRAGRRACSGSCWRCPFRFSGFSSGASGSWNPAQRRVVRSAVTFSGPRSAGH